MSVLEKFAQVKVDAAVRIPEDDAVYCKAEHQNYMAAHALYTVFRVHLAEGMELERKEWSARTGKTSVGHRSWAYLESYGDGGLDSIDKRIKEIQVNFIHGLVYYFADKYDIALNNDEVEKNLGFKAPEYSRYGSESKWELEMEAYRTKSTRLLHYNEIVDEILLQLDGLTFADKAIQQIKDNARNSAQNGYHHKANFAVAKKTIKFCDSFSHWQEHHRNVLRALWHYATGSTSLAGTWWSREFDIHYSYHSEDKRVGSAYEFEDWKVRKFRYYKSGRWDITFATAEDADTFAREYLGY